MNEKSWKDIFIDAPPVKPGIYGFPMQNSTMSEASNIPDSEINEIWERQEYAYKKSLQQRNG